MMMELGQVEREKEGSKEMEDRDSWMKTRSRRKIEGEKRGRRVTRRGV